MPKRTLAEWRKHMAASRENDEHHWGPVLRREFNRVESLGDPIMYAGCEVVQGQTTLRFYLESGEVLEKIVRAPKRNGKQS